MRMMRKERTKGMICSVELAELFELQWTLFVAKCRPFAAMPASWLQVEARRK